MLIVLLSYIVATSESSVITSSLDVSTSSEAQFSPSSDPLTSGGTLVTSSLTQPLMADKLMWSPSIPAGIKAEQPASGMNFKG